MCVINIMLKPDFRIVLQYLALRKEVGHKCSSDCVFEITIFKDDQRGFSTKLQSHWLYPSGSHFHYLLGQNMHLNTLSANQDGITCYYNNT